MPCYKLLAAVIGLSVLTIWRPALASPFQVDSTGIAEDIELKSAFEYRDASTKRTLIAPKLAVAFPLTADLEFEVGTGYRQIERDDRSASGLADSTLELKWRVSDDSKDGVAFALVPELSLPTGSERRGLGSGHSALVVPMIVEKEIGAMMLTGQFGYGHSFGGDEDYIPLGLLVTGKPLEDLKIGLELAGEAPRDRFSDCELNMNVGFKWKATRQMEIHGLVGRTVRSPGSAPTTRLKLVAEVRL
jgi:hypothetical protein